MDRNMVKERITIKMETNTLEIGLKIKRIREDRKLSQLFVYYD